HFGLIERSKDQLNINNAMNMTTTSTTTPTASTTSTVSTTSVAPTTATTSTSTRERGTIFNVFPERRYGFIRRNIGEEDIFFHITEYPKDQIVINTLVEFDIKQGVAPSSDRVRAVGITIIYEPNSNNVVDIRAARSTYTNGIGDNGFVPPTNSSLPPVATQNDHPNPTHNTNNANTEPELGCYRVVTDVTKNKLFLPVFPIDGEYLLENPKLRYLEFFFLECLLLCSCWKAFENDN
ncbi:hypothetical protein RFI_19629, partial [Reticulomyxa filosa]